MKIAVLPGDGIGPEIVVEAVKVLEALNLGLEMETRRMGNPLRRAGHPVLAGPYDGGGPSAGRSGCMVWPPLLAMVPVPAGN